MKFNRSVYQALTMIGQFGINMLVPVFACSFLGIFLDRKLQTDWLVIVFFFVGALAGGMNVYRFAQKIYSRNTEQSAYLHGSRRNRRRKHESKAEEKDCQNKQNSV